MFVPKETINNMARDIMRLQDEQEYLTAKMNAIHECQLEILEYLEVYWSEPTPSRLVKKGGPERGD